jgi:hypothetical protein
LLPGNLSGDEAAAIVQALKQTPQAICYVNPADPDEAVLDRVNRWTADVFMPLILIVVPAAAMALMAIKPRWLMSRMRQ